MKADGESFLRDGITKTAAANSLTMDMMDRPTYLAHLGKNKLRLKPLMVKDDVTGEMVQRMCVIPRKRAGGARETEDEHLGKLVRKSKREQVSFFPPFHFMQILPPLLTKHIHRASRAASRRSGVRLAGAQPVWGFLRCSHSSARPTRRRAVLRWHSQR